MFNIILQNKILTGVVMAIVLAGAWYGLTATTSTGPILQSATPAADGSQEIVATLLALRSVKLSGTIFSDPVFMSLQDFGVEIQQEPVGRPNPFLPLTSNTLPPQQTQQSIHNAQIFAPATKK